MYWFKAARTTLKRQLLLSLLVVSNPLWAIEGFMIGGGGETDSGDGLSGVVFADVGVTESTWISASFGTNSLDLPNGSALDTNYGDLGIDHWFDPLGVTLEVAYWGDDTILKSNDLRGSVYWRNDRFSIKGEYEYRDFEFTIPATDLFAGRRASFDAKGVGASARWRVNDVLSFNLAGIDYDYSVRLNLESNAGILTLLSVSRLSVINSLIDYRVGGGVNLDIGEQSWSLDYRTYKGAVDGSMTDSTTVRFLTPLGERFDLELGFGVDDSDRYGSATYFSVYLFFYG